MGGWEVEWYLQLQYKIHPYIFNYGFIATRD